MNESNRNMIIAIVLSVVVLFGWQFFVAGPQMQRAQQQAEITAQQAAAANPGLATSTTKSATGSTATPANGAATTTTAAARRVRVIRVLPEKENLDQKLPPSTDSPRPSAVRLWMARFRGQASRQSGYFRPWCSRGRCPPT